MTNISELLSRRCMLVNLHLKQWSGRIQDREVTDEILEAKSASSDSGRFWKYLVREELKPVHKYANGIRNWVYSWSYSWSSISGDSGDHWRICTVDVYDAHKTELKDRIRKLKNLWIEFLSKYPSYVEEDMKDKGTMANRNDYPSVEILETKFAVKWSVRQLPVSGDFRIELADEEFEKMKQAAVDKDREIVDAMIKESWERIAMPLQRLIDNLSDPEKKFKNVTITDISKVANLMRGFNVMNDPKINAICDEMDNRLGGYNPDDIRKDPQLRKQVAEDAKDIAESFSSYF